MCDNAKKAVSKTVVYRIDSGNEQVKIGDNLIKAGCGLLSCIEIRGYQSGAVVGNNFPLLNAAALNSGAVTLRETGANSDTHEKMPMAYFVADEKRGCACICFSEPLNLDTENSYFEFPTSVLPSTTEGLQVTFYYES